MNLLEYPPSIPQLIILATLAAVLCIGLVAVGEALLERREQRLWQEKLTPPRPQPQKGRDALAAVWKKDGGEA